MQRLTSLLMLSTPSGDEGQSYFTRLMVLKDDATDKPFFNVVRIGVSCEDCEAAGTPWLCNHVQQENPWMSSKKKRRLTKFYEGKEDRHKQENYGMVVGNSDMAYKEEIVAALYTRDIFRVEAPPRALYLAIDPSGGGKSDMAFTLAFENRGMIVVSTLTNYSMPPNHHHHPIPSIPGTVMVLWGLFSLFASCPSFCACPRD